jgi:hypothetical protein
VVASRAESSYKNHRAHANNIQAFSSVSETTTWTFNTLERFWWSDPSFLPEREAGHPCTALYYSTCCGEIASYYQIQTCRDFHGIVRYSRRVLIRHFPGLSEAEN